MLRLADAVDSAPLVTGSSKSRERVSYDTKSEGLGLVSIQAVLHGRHAAQGQFWYVKLAASWLYAILGRLCTLCYA